MFFFFFFEESLLSELKVSVESLSLLCYLDLSEELEVPEESLLLEEDSYLKDITFKVSKGAKIRNRYNQVPHLTQDTNGKVTISQEDITNESQEVSPSQQVTTRHI